MSIDRRKFLLNAISHREFETQGTRIPIKIAGIRIDWVTYSNELTDHIHRLFENYLISADSQISNHGEIFATPYSPTGALSFIWEDPDPEFEIRDHTVIQRDFAAKRTGNRAIAMLAPNLDDAIHNCLRWFIPNMLLENFSFLLHGAAVIRDGFGYVFFGQSGAGKSTTVEMISKADSNALLLGDDAVIVHFNPITQSAEVHAAPLGCGYSRFSPPNISAPLAGIYPLKQDIKHSLKSVPLSQKVFSLLASAMTDQWDNEVEARFNLAALFASAPCSFKNLHFKKNSDFWPMVLNDTL